MGDGIARVAGLPDTAVNELLEFEGGTARPRPEPRRGDSIGAVVLGKSDQVEEGQAVKATGRILSVPVGDALIGRVVNALGQPIDGKGPIASDTQCAGSRSRRRASSAASRCTSRCRPASRRSTP